MVISPTSPTVATDISLAEFLQNPVDRMEWVDGQLIEITSMTLKHSEIQSSLSHYWRTYLDANQLGGKVYTEAPCRTNKQVRRPDVAYLPPDLVAQYGQEAVLPQSFPLVAEIASPTDEAEGLFAKAQEYLASGSVEVWLIFPESQWLLIATGDQLQGWMQHGQAETQAVLQGFKVELSELWG